MRYILIFLALFLLASQAIVPPASADTRYVGDQLIITLRQGKSTKHKILKTLETGTPLEVLEEDESYFKVRTTDGVEGYVLRQYVSSNPPKTQRIEELEMLNSSLQKEIRSLEESRKNLELQLKTVQENYEQKYSSATSKYTDIEQNLEQALNNERMMAEKYDTLAAQAENVVEIAADRDQLRQKNTQLETEVAALQQKIDKVDDSRMIKWFLAGGGVLLLGWIMGKISRKKRSRF